MNKDKQRIKIAEACGFTNLHTEKEWEERGGPDGWDGHYEVLRGTLDGEEDIRVPDYVNSLDAMHEAEKVLDGNLGEYVKVLSKVMTGVEDFIQWPSVVAPAHKRAEAFLKTLKLWEE